MKITKMKVAELKPLEVNVRRHSETQLKELIRSLNQFGQTRAIVIDEENNILIGNGLHAAMVKAEMSECFVFRKTGLSEKEKKKLILADNKTFALGIDDYENIEAYLSDITADGDFDIAGFDEESLRGLMRDAEEVLADATQYGVLPESVATAKREAAERTEKRTQEAAQQPKDEYAATPSNAVEAHEYAQESESMKTIICPSCGEVIGID